MIKELQAHLFSYIVLIIFLVIAIIMFLAAWPNLVTQRLIALAIGLFYTIWGMLTHVKANRLTRKLTMEYLLAGTLATLLLVLVTL